MRARRELITTMFLGSALLLMIAAFGYAQPAMLLIDSQPMPPDSGLLVLVSTGLIGLASTGWPGTRA